MRQFIHKSGQNLPDVAEFIELIKNPPPHLRDFFDAQSEIYVTRAPGRLDVMGGIADYSGSLVLEMPIREATLAALQRDPSRKIKILSLSEEVDEDLTFEMPLADFKDDGQPIEYEKARAYFEQMVEHHWAAYVAGIFLVLMRERSVDFKSGARILISSRIPKGKGVSSSATLEVAATQAVGAAFGIRLEPKETALLCQKVENLIVGAPCGVMDQMTSVSSESG